MRFHYTYQTKCLVNGKPFGDVFCRIKREDSDTFYGFTLNKDNEKYKIAKLYNQFEKSNLSQRKFCSQNNISRSSFYRHSKRARHKSALTGDDNRAKAYRKYWNKYWSKAKV